jgi:myo-inositol 2-dehydrogenase/D-chiro-inositol 1-dehydrogenase
MTVKVIVVGTGGIAQQHGKALVQNEGAEIIGAIDVDRAKAEAFVASFGGRVYETLTECLDGADAVYVLTPPSFRRRYAVEAIEAGKHVFCEKPLAIAPEDGKAIAEAAEAEGVIAMTGFNMRYRLGYGKLKDAVASGTLGTPYHFWVHRFGMGAGGDGTIDQTNWRTDKDLCCGMTIESLSHDIDLIRWILEDEVAQVSGWVHSTVEALPNFDNNTQALLKMRGGATVVINASWSSRIGTNTRGVLGETGTVFVEGTDVGNNGIWCSTRFHLKTDADDFERIEMIHDDLDTRSYQAETDNFIAAIETGGQPLTSAWDGYETLRVSQAILKSSETGKVIKFES